MTMNVAGAVLLLGLTVTSSQPGAWQNVLPPSPISFATEDNTENEVSFEKNELVYVTSNYENAVTAATVAAIEEIEEAQIIAQEAAVPVYENRWGIQLTEEEIDLLAKIVWVEARGESEQGQRAVIEVIFNRIVSEKFPNNLYDVLSQKNPVQFASWKLRDTAKPTEKEYTSIYTVLNGDSSVVREDTLYFATKKLTRNLDVKIDGHYFCY